MLPCTHVNETGVKQQSVDGEPNERTAVAAVVTASRVLVGVSARSLDALDDDVTVAQYRALVVLASRGAQSVGALAEVLSIHPSTATRLCDRLERKKLIDRQVSTESRREVTVGVTAAASKLLSGVTERRRTEIQSLVRNMSGIERQRLVDAFELLAEAAGELPDDAWKLGWS